MAFSGQPDSAGADGVAAGQSTPVDGILKWTELVSKYGIGDPYPMSVDTIATLSGMVIIVGFLWSLHRDVAELRERMARMEGAMGVLSGNVQSLMQVLIGQEPKR